MEVSGFFERLIWYKRPKRKQSDRNCFYNENQKSSAILDTIYSFAGIIMILIKHIAIAVPFATLLLFAHPVFAVDDYYQQQLQYQQMLKRQREQIEQQEDARYRKQVGDKALLGATNIISSPLEIPKNIINLTNEPGGNIFYGIIGGVIRGSIDVAGRVTNGVSDLVTAPLPTKRVVEPRYVWDDFDQYDSYGKVFRLVDNPKIEAEPIPPPQRIVEAPVSDPTDQYYQETNRNLDTMFQQEMMK
jgi:putative exosortase-associated protein (TIGR04073 family)